MGLLTPLHDDWWCGTKLYLYVSSSSLVLLAVKETLQETGKLNHFNVSQI